jgi:hypothetical protein
MTKIHFLIIALINTISMNKLIVRTINSSIPIAINTVRKQIVGHRPDRTIKITRARLISTLTTRIYRKKNCKISENNNSQHTYYRPSKAFDFQLIPNTFCLEKMGHTNP